MENFVVNNKTFFLYHSADLYYFAIISLCEDATAGENGVENISMELDYSNNFNIGKPLNTAIGLK